MFTGFQYVTCGSVLKLASGESNIRLHSHDVKYGSGSGQQVYCCLSLKLAFSLVCLALICVL